MTDEQLTAQAEKVNEFVGAGCMIQGAGLAAPFLLGYFFGIPGIVIGLIVLAVLGYVGSEKASKWRCGHCKNFIADAKVRMCPVCKAQLR